MSGSTMKHKDFVSEPMGEKPVTDLAGIGAILGERLIEAGYDKAYTVLGQFLLLKKDKEIFTDWMNDVCVANANQATACYNCLSDWCDQFL